VKNNALPFHNRAMPAALAAMAAHEQGKFFEMHDEIFENMRALEDADLERYAQAVGLDMERWKASFTSQAAKPHVEADMELAGKVNARGTPNFFVNGRNLRGAVPFEDFDALIEEELEKARALVAAGTPAAEVYNKIIGDGKVFEPLEAQVHEFTSEGRPFLGNPNGDIVISEFSDFQ
jgi:protein-disulfide isomerase